MPSVGFRSRKAYHSIIPGRGLRYRAKHIPKQRNRFHESVNIQGWRRVTRRQSINTFYTGVKEQREREDKRRAEKRREEKWDIHKDRELCISLSGWRSTWIWYPTNVNKVLVLLGVGGGDECKTQGLPAPIPNQFAHIVLSKWLKITQTVPLDITSTVASPSRASLASTYLWNT